LDEPADGFSRDVLKRMSSETRPLFVRMWRGKFGRPVLMTFTGPLGGDSIT
jgi:hypothetical protein